MLCDYTLFLNLNKNTKKCIYNTKLELLIIHYKFRILIKNYVLNLSVKNISTEILNFISF